MSPLKVQEFHFGRLEYHDCYAIGILNHNTKVDTAISKTILSALKERYGKKKIVYISDRELTHEVDPAVYKFIDHKTLVAIAVVSSKREEAVISASQEQAVYKGSFGVFNTLESAVSWAKSFIDQENIDCD